MALMLGLARRGGSNLPVLEELLAAMPLAMARTVLSSNAT
jgi:hypothetical protein